MSNYFLGIDGGGTKTRSILLDDKGQLISAAESEGSNYKAIGGIDTAFNNLKSSIDKLLAHIDINDLEIFSCFALSGVNYPWDIKMWEDKMEKEKEFSKIFAKPPLIINDIIASLRSGTSDKNAVCVISGTGSNCYGRNERGVEVRVGGQDYLLSDEGSGYWIGLEVLKNITKAVDGRGRSTILTELFSRKYGVKSISEMAQLVYKKPWNKTDIAEITELIEISIKQNDIVSREIMEKAATELSLMAKVAIEKLNITHTKSTLVISGSIFQKFNIIYDLFKNDINLFAPDVNITFPVIESSHAAALIAAKYYMNFDF